MIAQLLKYDITVSNFFAGLIPHNGFFNTFFSFFSLKGYSIFIWILIVGLLLIFEAKRDKKHHFIAYFLTTFITTAFLVSYPLKTIFHRIRPIQNVLYSLSACPKDFSFPSGHAATAFAAASFLAFHDKKRKWVYYLVAVLISFSRIYLECHYLVDVISGAIVGLIITQGVLWIQKKSIKS
jgi:undecaprenyl-diphosphatase